MGDFIFTSGSVNLSSSTVTFGDTVAFGALSANTFITLAAPVYFNNVNFEGGASSSYSRTISGGMYVDGILNLQSSVAGGEIINGSSIIASNDVYIANQGAKGTAGLIFFGPNPQNLSALGANTPGGQIRVNKSAALTLTSNASFNTAAQDLYLQAGSIIMNAFNLTINSNSTALNGNTITKGGGVLTIGGSAIGTGALFGGTINP
jgi:hypothetical protein